MRIYPFYLHTVNPEVYEPDATILYGDALDWLREAVDLCGRFASDLTHGERPMAMVAGVGPIPADNLPWVLCELGDERRPTIAERCCAMTHQVQAMYPGDPDVAANAKQVRQFFAGLLTSERNVLESNMQRLIPAGPEPWDGWLDDVDEEAA